MASVLERVLQTSEERRLTRKHPGDQRLVWKLHKAHTTSSTTSSNICTSLSQELAKTNINTFDHPTKGLDTFDSYLTTYNKIAQFVADSKSSAPVTKNRNLRTVYRMELDDSDGYESDYCKLQGYILI